MKRRDTPLLPGQLLDQRRLMAAWERFLVDHEAPGNLVRRVVEESWQRCQTTHVDPHLKHAPLRADADRVERLRERHADVRAAARPLLLQARELLGSSQTLLLLTDPEGLILEMEGDPRTCDEAHDINLIIGGLWDESFVGTNAIGTALAIEQPLQVFGGEHFCEGIKRWTCSAAIIRDPHDGRPLGVLDVSGLADTHHSHSLALVIAAARQIENNLAEQYFKLRSWILEACMDLCGRWSGQGVLAVDSRGRLVKANPLAEAALRGHADDLMLASQTRIVGLDTSLSGAERLSSLPQWVHPEWLHPIYRGKERIGTLIVIPPARVAGARASIVNRSAKAGGPDSRGFARILGNSPAMCQVLEKARRLAQAPVPVLLLGETGVGKEVFARALHEEGPTGGGPFVAVNCGALSKELLPSELFGYVEGAFTGARRGGMPGKFEAADGGTLFLDEIGEMPLELQPQLLRVLQEREVVRLGDNRPRKVNVRVLAATNRDLRAEVARGSFRSDLYYRLSVAALRLPPLREREGDLELLLSHLQAQLAREYGLQPRPLSPELLAALRHYGWPGNVRELRNALESMLLMATGDHLTVADLPAEIADTVLRAETQTLERLDTPRAGGGDTATLTMTDVPLATLEREAILTAITTQHGNLTRVAKQLGIARSTLYKKMEQYGIARL